MSKYIMCKCQGITNMNNWVKDKLKCQKCKKVLITKINT